MVVTVVGYSGGASGGGFAEHGGGCPLVTDELGDAAPDTCFAVWVQPAAPATRTAAIAARRVRRNFQADIGITVLRPIFFLKVLKVQRVRSCRKRQMTASVRTIGLFLAVLLDEPEDVSTGRWGLRGRSGATLSHGPGGWQRAILAASGATGDTGRPLGRLDGRDRTAPCGGLARPSGQSAVCARPGVRMT